MKRHIFIVLLLTILFSGRVAGQPKSHIRHYNLQEGIPQRTIMDITQDRKGFIWLATWDGLCKFDGYNFTTYKTFPEDSILMSNNRIDKILEDTYGFIWARSYSGEPFRFSPKTEKYVATFKRDSKPFKTHEILPMPSGRVWLTSHTMGAICVMDSLNNFYLFDREKNNLPANFVHTVFEDSDRFSWILTGKGLVRLPADITKSEDSSVFFDSADTAYGEMPFFTAIEIENEIWFGSGKGQIWRYNKNDKIFSPYELDVSSNIISIKKVYENLFAILTSNDGFLICDRGMTNVKRFNRSIVKELPTDEMLSCFVDSNNNLWLETNSKGVAKFNLINNKLKYYRPNDYGNNELYHPDYFIIEDKEGHIWVHPHGGFSYYDAIQDKLLPFYNNPHSPEWRFSDALHEAFLDNQGILWLSTRSGGLEKVVFDNRLFKLNDFYSSKSSVTGYEVRAMLEDNHHNLWLGNLDGLISIYDSNRIFKGYLCTNGTVSASGNPLRLPAYALLQDSRGNIWIGTKGDGIYLLKPKDRMYTTFSIEQFKHVPSDVFSLSSNAVYTIHEDNRGRIWIGTYGGGINLFDSENKRFINYHNQFENYPFETAFQIRNIQSHEDKIYVGSTMGLVVLSIDSVKDNITGFKIYTKSYSRQDGLRANDIHNIHVTKDKNIYIATFGGGVAKVNSWDENGFPAAFKTYDSRHGLQSDIVLSITEDHNNRLWMNSEGSLSRFTAEDELFEQFNDVSHVIGNQHFTETLPLFTSDGELIYGCAEGTLSFYPEKINTGTYIPYLALTGFMISNQEYPMDTKIDDIQEITLTYKQNIFSIEYAALDYISPHDILYSYKLEGFDNDWVEARNQRIANYTNISPGKYIFKVRSTNSNRTWVDNERSILIHITPSFWQTNWAWFLYIISFILILFIILKSIILYYRMRDKVLLEQEQTEMKTRFFTDISHEIRTPLTMIVSPIENLLENQHTMPEVKKQLQFVLKNANRMLKMVNQILDFRRIQKQKLQVKEIAIGEYIENLVNTFFKIAEAQNLSIRVNNEIGTDKIWADPDAIEKLLSNLISNSIKYSHEGGQIEINLFRRDKMIAVQVSDQGVGMSKEVLGKLFTRFASFNKDKSKPSTGIGLSMVKEITDKHHAKIIVDSDLNKGTSFTIFFQTGMEHFSKDEHIEIIQTRMPETGEPDEQVLLTEEESNSTRLSVLITEDDEDLRTFIKSVLKDHYDIHEAANGAEGYEYAVKYNPDFILSDIMMPEMDGIEFLHKIRNNQNTSHIPFILLTAKTNIDDQLKGITSGANDYITKPFSVKLLIAKIENIINQRKMYLNYIADEHFTESEEETKELIEQTKITGQDELFLRNLKECIYQNLDNSDFTIDELVSNTSLSRRVFFNKVKSLTGQAPVQFVREMRIRHAARLLNTQQYRIKEVGYMVGFSDMRYFTQCFKEIFGVTPSQYKEAQNQDK